MCGVRVFWSCFLPVQWGVHDVVSANAGRSCIGNSINVVRYSGHAYVTKVLYKLYRVIHVV